MKRYISESPNKAKTAYVQCMYINLKIAEKKPINIIIYSIIIIIINTKNQENYLACTNGRI